MPGQYIDCGIKIFEMPLKIKKIIILPNGSKTPHIKKSIFDKIWGMAVAGSSTNAYLIKEITLQIFKQLSLQCSYTEFVIEHVCDYL